MSKATAALFKTDAYKLDHRRQYPEGTEGVLSNYTNRGTRIEGVEGVVHFGLQAFLDELTESFQDFFNSDVEVVVNEYAERVSSILGPNNVGTDHIRALHDLGYLPLVFRALPEGTIVPLRVPSFTIENTLPEFFWLVNYLETWISASVWQPSTTATITNRFRKLINKAALETTGSIDGTEFQLHDFSFRGDAGVRAAQGIGAGHLLSSLGSDTLASLDFIEDHYAGDNGWILGSVAATEHSVMCAGGSDEGDEQATFQRLLNLYPSGILSVVSDTWNLWNVLEVILPNLKEQILARDGKLVVRPDSGDPVNIITGTVLYEDGPSQFDSIKDTFTPAEKGVVELLWDTFGGTINEQGYKVLDSHIGAIYGDSITYDRAGQIIDRLKAKGFASTNIVFGVGSYTYQYQTRDTFMSAIKATWVQINGEEHDIFKNPITDSGMKKSAKGRIAVVRTEGGLTLMDGDLGARYEYTQDDQLKVIWQSGEFVRRQSFAEIREILANQA